jgi:hypothetical protein
MMPSEQSRSVSATSCSFPAGKKGQNMRALRGPACIPFSRGPPSMGDETVNETGLERATLVGSLRPLGQEQAKITRLSCAHLLFFPQPKRP